MEITSTWPMDYRKFREESGGAPKTDIRVHWEYEMGNTIPYFGRMDGKVVAQYNLRREQWNFFGNLVEGALCFDVATHPDYRGKGLFVEMGKHAMAKRKQHGTAFCIGFPNEQALPGHLKVGWKAIGEVPMMEFRGQEYTESSEFKRIYYFGTHYNGKEVQLYRAMHYLDWRFFEKPGTEYEVYECKNGYFVLKEYWDSGMETRRLHLVDWVAPLDEFERIVDFYKGEAWRRNDDVTNLICNWTSPEAAVLKDQGFVEKHTGRQFIVYQCTDEVDDRIFDLKNYKLTMADSDVF